MNLEYILNCYIVRINDKSLQFSKYIIVFFFFWNG